jgi:hypothetical protein
MVQRRTEAGGNEFAFDLTVQGCLATRTAEDYFVGKERYPFVRLGGIGGAAPDQFMFSVRVPDQPGFAKLLNNPAVGVVGAGVIQFHAVTLRLWVGHWLSRRKIIES